MSDNLNRCESVTMKCRAVEEGAEMISSKKRKCYSELESQYDGGEEVAENSVSPAASRISGCSERDESSEAEKKGLSSPDLENEELHSEGFGTEISTSAVHAFSRETTPTSELYGDSEQLMVVCSSKKKSTTPPPAIPRRKIPDSCTENMPSAAELEEFFAAAEKYEQKRFAEKYNYDIVKDVPLEGAYQWVRLQPK